MRNEIADKTVCKPRDFESTENYIPKERYIAPEKM